MTTPARFHLDVSTDGRVAKGLRHRDRDCSLSKDVGLLGASDHEQLDFAAQEQRVIITRDSDFVALHKDHPDHAGIIYWQSDDHFGMIIKKID